LKGVWAFRLSKCSLSPLSTISSFFYNSLLKERMELHVYTMQKANFLINNTVKMMKGQSTLLSPSLLRNVFCFLQQRRTAL
jgi:hypothetical protein